MCSIVDVTIAVAVIIIVIIIIIIIIQSRRGAVVKGVEHISTNLSTSEWRVFESRWFYQSGFEFAKTSLLILYH